MLLIGPNALDPFVGAGVTLRSLFAEWPRERLAQIYSYPRGPDRSAAAFFFRLNDGEPRVRPLLLREIVRASRSIVGRAETAALFGRITPRLERWLDRASPEIILTQLGGLGMGRISLEIARRRRIPLVLHVSDDWVSGWPANVIGRSIFPVTHVANRLMKGVLHDAMRDAAAVTVISEEMAEEYERRYGRRGVVVRNGADLVDWPARAPGPAGSPARLLYSGSVFAYAQQAGLEDIRDALGRLNDEGHRVELVIRTQHRDVPAVRRAFGASRGTKLERLVPRDALVSEMAAADVLLLPVSFDRVTVDFVRLSLPGKLAEYAASGTPILYYGPRDVAQARWLERHGAALLVTERDPAGLRSAIVRIVSDDGLRASLAANSRRAAESELDIRVLRARLYETLRGAMVASR